MASSTTTVTDSSQTSIGNSSLSTQEPIRPNSTGGIKKVEAEFAQFLHATPEMKNSVNTLLKVSDFYSSLLSYHPNPRPYDFVDVICGWEATVANPIYASGVVVPTNVSKKRRAKTFVECVRRPSKVDDCTVTEYIHNDMVEEDTYRYVPNNGMYRLAKQKSKLVPGNSKIDKIETNYTFMPKKPSLNTEQRQLQRMVNRELKVAFLDKKKDEVRDYGEDESVRTVDATSRSDRTPRGAEALRVGPDVRNDDVKNGYSPSVVRTGTKDFRRRKREKTFAPVEEKPSDPNVLSKAFTERIMKNFTSKISALEDQIRGEANWWAMAAGGATYLSEKQSAKRSHSLPIDSIQVVSVNKGSLPLRPLQKLPQTAAANKVYNSQTGPQNTPRYNYLDSYILNPLNLEAARPKQPSPRATKEQNDVVKASSSDSRRINRKLKEERMDTDESVQQGFQSSPIGKPNPRDKKVDLVNEPDIIAPSVTLPELFGKKLQVAVTTQKFL